MAVTKDALPAAGTAGGDVMETPEDVAVMLRLKGLGCGVRSGSRSRLAAAATR